MIESTRTKNSNRISKLLTGFLLVFVFGAVVLIPFSGSVDGMGPISTAWAAPNCDADGDGFEKDRGKCLGDDPNDSDPCIPDVLAAACTSGGGGDGGGSLGSAIPMDCLLEGISGDGSGETIKSDSLGDYEDGVDKVDCSIGGPSVPWPIRLGVGIKGRPQNSVRKVDVILGDFDMGAFGGTGGTSWLSVPYPNLFVEANSLNLDEMEPIRLSVRPYRKDPDQTEESIHLLPAGKTYEMGMRLAIPGTERFNISVASQHYPGNEGFTGIGCETGDEAGILANAPGGGGMKDVSVYLWPDGPDADENPDAYTVSTGTIVVAGDGSASVPVPGSKWAAVCSSVGPLTCGNPKAPSNCNFLGYVEVQFTIHTMVK